MRPAPGTRSTGVPLLPRELQTPHDVDTANRWSIQMTDPKTSPAAQAYEREKARQSEHESKGDLDQALEDTFPASDPVSYSVTSVAGAPPPIEPPARPGFVHHARTWIKANPIAAVAMAAAVAWVLGATR
jgi:ferric-dicitrate binding protein FerR (iron transport regulator)